jgi:predicted transcriptional regulator
MLKTLPVSVRLDPALNDELAAIAVALDRSKSWVIERAIRTFIEVERHQLGAVDLGLSDARRGRFVAHSDVVAWIRSWGQANELPQPE